MLVRVPQKLIDDVKGFVKECNGLEYYRKKFSIRNPLRWWKVNMVTFEEAKLRELCRRMVRSIQQASFPFLLVHQEEWQLSYFHAVLTGVSYSASSLRNWRKNSPKIIIKSYKRRNNIGFSNQVSTGSLKEIGTLATFMP